MNEAEFLHHAALVREVEQQIADYKEEVRRWVEGYRWWPVKRPACLNVRQAQRLRAQVYKELRAEFPERDWSQYPDK